jgi:hypothetical protein
MPISPSDPDYHEILTKYRQEAQQERKAIAKLQMNRIYKNTQKIKNAQQISPQ